MVDDVLPGALQATFWPAPRIPSDGHLALWGPEAEALEAAVRAAGLPTGSAASLPTVLPVSRRRDPPRASPRGAPCPARTGGWPSSPPRTDDDDAAVWPADELLGACFDAVADAPAITARR